MIGESKQPLAEHLVKTRTNAAATYGRRPWTDAAPHALQDFRTAFVETSLNAKKSEFAFLISWNAVRYIQLTATQEPLRRRRGGGATVARYIHGERGGTSARRLGARATARVRVTLEPRLVAVSLVQQRTVLSNLSRYFFFLPASFAGAASAASPPPLLHAGTVPWYQARSA